MDYYILLDYLNYHNSPTHDDTFVTLFRKSPLVTFLPLAFEYNSVDILVTRKGLFYPIVEKKITSLLHF